MNEDEILDKDMEIKKLQEKIEGHKKLIKDWEVACDGVVKIKELKKYIQMLKSQKKILKSKATRLKKEIKNIQDNIDEPKTFSISTNNSVTRHFVLDKLKELENKVTINNIIDIAEEYVSYKADDYREEGKEEVREEVKKELDDMFNEGIKQGMTMSKICLHCRKRIIESIHHILPRGYGGETFEANIIALCNKCHDEVEILTDELLKVDNHYTIDDLRSFIISNGFPNKDIIKKESIKVFGLVSFKSWIINLIRKVN